MLQPTEPSGQGTVDIILNENNCIKITEITYANVKHSENSESYKEENKKSHSAWWLHICSQDRCPISSGPASVCACVLILVLLSVLLLRQVLSLLYKYKSYKNRVTEFV